MKTYALLASTALVVSACAAPAVNYNPLIPYDPAEGEAITSLTIGADALPEEITATDLPMDYAALSNQVNAQTNAMVTAGTASPGAAAAGGVIGILVVAAIDAGIDANRNANTREYFSGTDIDPHLEFESALLTALADAGFDTEMTSFGTEDNGFTSASELSSMSIGNDAVLEIVVANMGFQVGGPGWVPAFNASVRLTRPSDGAILMDDRLTYHGLGGVDNAIQPEFAMALSGLGVTIAPSFDEGVSGYGEIVDNDGDPELGLRLFRASLNEAADTIAHLVSQNLEPTKATNTAPVSQEADTVSQDGAEAPAGAAGSTDDTQETLARSGL